MGLIFGLALAFLAGLAMVEVAITGSDMELASRIFGVVCGIIMMAPGVVIFGPVIADAIKKSKERRKDKKNNPGVKSGSIFRGLFILLIMQLKFMVFLNKEEVLEDKDDLEKRMSGFRRAYSDFFSNKFGNENSTLQNEATQVNWHILSLQKKRLKNRDIVMELDSTRMKYGEYEPVTKNAVFDGKYQVVEATETVEASKLFKKNNKVIGRDKCTQIARYKFLFAKSTSKGGVICPNCGKESTRENLLDGCDYCGTKFTVEDLGMRVSDFGFRADYELAYDKYRDARSRFSLWVGLLVGIPTAILSLIGIIWAFLDDAANDAGPFMMLCAAVIVVAFLTFSAVFFALLFFYFIVFPGIQLVASTMHFANKNLEELKKSQKTDEELEARIKADDPLFSIEGFYSDIQNKLSTIYFGDTDSELCAFAEGPAEQAILEHRKEFENVINVETEWLRVAGYRVDEGMRKMLVETMVVLTNEKNGRLKRTNKYIRFEVQRTEKRKTQAVCGPSFMNCKSCGASISFLEGKTCKHCGSARRLSDSDWTIVNIF